MRGRKQTPTMLHELHGKPGKRALNKLEPKPAGDLIEAPAWLSPEQIDAWRYAIANAPPGLMKMIDRDVLRAWVVAQDLHRKATIEQNDIGLLAVTPNKMLVQSGYIPIINRQALIMKALATELGFSPAARPRLSVDPGGDGKSKPKGRPGSLAAFLSEDEGEGSTAVN